MELVALIEAARAYEDLHVPALFASWAARVVGLSQLRPEDSILDVACGTGILARTAAQSLGSTAGIVGVDPHPGMLAVAREIEPAIRWESGKAEDLPFPVASFDAVLSQFGLMFFADREAAVREMLRVLKPGKPLVVAVWDEVGSQPAYADLLKLLQRRAGEAAADALRAPFGLGDPVELRGLFEAVGVTNSRVYTEKEEAKFPSIRSMVEAELRGWLPAMGVVLDEDVIQQILVEAESVLRPYCDASGSPVFQMTAHVVVAEGAR